MKEEGLFFLVPVCSSEQAPAQHSFSSIWLLQCMQLLQHPAPAMQTAAPISHFCSTDNSPALQYMVLQYMVTISMQQQVPASSTHQQMGECLHLFVIAFPVTLEGRHLKHSVNTSQRLPHPVSHSHILPQQGSALSQGWGIGSNSFKASMSALRLMAAPFICYNQSPIIRVLFTSY